MKNLFFFILLNSLWISISCKHTGNSEILKINLESINKIDLEASIPIEEFASNVTCIPLETTDSCLIDGIQKCIETKDYFFIHSSEGKLYKFTTAGKFLHSIGTIGQGPEEYIDIKNFQLDEADSIIYVMDYLGRKMIKYHFDGHFVSSFHLPDNYFITSFCLDKPQIAFLASTNSINLEITLYNEKDSSLTLLSRREREMEKGEGFIGDIYSYQLDGKTFLYHYFNDTVYTLNKDSLIPAYYIKMGKRTFEYPELNVMKEMPHTQSRIQLNGLNETARYVFIFYTITHFRENIRTNVMSLYDKQNKKFYPHINLVSSNRPYVSIRNGQLLTKGLNNSVLLFQDPSYLIKTGYPKKINEEDNPIIIRYTLK